MGSRESIDQVIAIVRKYNRKAPIVTVVSAMAGVTNRLLNMGQAALDGRKHKKIGSELVSLRDLHEAAFVGYCDSKSHKAWLRRFLNQEFEEIRRSLSGNWSGNGTN